jgi:hypothetical protein
MSTNAVSALMVRLDSTSTYAYHIVASRETGPWRRAPARRKAAGGSVRRTAAGLGLVAALWLVAPAVAVASHKHAAVDYSTAPFTETTNSYAYGQAPVFLPDGKTVLFGKDFQTGEKNQIYSASFPSGSDVTCLTCTGPDDTTNNVNGVPAVRPQGDWVLFSSWRGREITFGSPGRSAPPGTGESAARCG